MRNVLRLLAVFAVGLLLLPAAAHATSTQKGTYVAATVLSSPVQVSDRMGGFVNPGGSLSVTPTSTLVNLKVTDIQGSDVAVEYCQKSAGNTTGICNGDPTHPDNAGTVCVTPAGRNITVTAGLQLGISFFAVDVLDCSAGPLEGTYLVTF